MIRYRKSTKYDVIIGIDPDAEKNGVALVNTSTMHIEVSTLSFADTIDYLQWAKQQAETKQTKYIVVVEAGWQAHTNWHLKPTDSRQKCAALGNAVGRNHETGRKIIEMCKHHNINVREQHPLIKKWGKSGNEKISHKELNEIVLPQHSFAPIIGRTNQEQRDALLIALSEW